MDGCHSRNCDWKQTRAWSSEAYRHRVSLGTRDDGHGKQDLAVVFLTNHVDAATMLICVAGLGISFSIRRELESLRTRSSEDFEVSMNPVRKIVDRQFVHDRLSFAVVCADTDLKFVTIYEVLFEFVPCDRSVQLFAGSLNLTTSTDLLGFVVVSLNESIFGGSPAEVLFAPHVLMLMSPIRSGQHLLVDNCVGRLCALV